MAINSGRAGTKRSTDNMHALDIRKIARAGLLVPGGTLTWQWSRGGNVTASIGGIVDSTTSVTLHYRTRKHGGEWQDKRYQVAVSWTACNYGGTRPWWLCPCCGRRVAVLWGGSTYACRQCQRLTYKSQKETPSSAVYRRADNLRAQLGWVPGVIHGAGRKPKGMHWQTFWRLLAIYDDHEQQTLAGMAVKIGLINRKMGRIKL